MIRHSLLLVCLLLPRLAVADVPASLAEAEAAYVARKDPARLQKALELWQGVLKEDPANAEAAWKLSRAAIWWGDHAPEGKRGAIHKKGMDWGKLATKLAPTNPESHYWLAANMGSYGRAHGIVESASMIKPMKAICEHISKIAPNYWRANMLLGMIYREAPGWPISIGDDELAVVQLKKAVALAPNYPRPLYELGLGLAEIGDDAGAKQALQKATSVPPEPEFELESAETKAKAQAKLKDLD